MFLPDLHPLDKITLAHLPVLAVPRRSPMPACPENTRRFLMTSDGLKLEAVTPWGRIVRTLWTSPTLLPYGEMPDTLALTRGPLPASLITEAAASARGALPNEWAGWIVTDPALGYKLLDIPPSSAGAGHITINRPVLPAGVSLVADIHSHGAMPAFFSSTDDKDDAGGIRFSIVIGTVDQDTISIESRICVEGLFFILDPHQIVSNIFSQ